MPQNTTAPADDLTYSAHRTALRAALDKVVVPAFLTDAPDKAINGTAADFEAWAGAHGVGRVDLWTLAAERRRRFLLGRGPRRSPRRTDRSGIVWTSESRAA